MIYFIHSTRDELFNIQVQNLCRDLEIVNFELSPERAIEFTNELNSIDLFGTNKAYIVSGANFFQIKSHTFRKKELGHLIDALNATPYMVIIKLTKELNFKNPNVNLITAKKDYINLKDEKQATKYFIDQLIQENNIQIGHEALNLINSNLSGDYLLMKNELLKLQNFANNGEITTNIIRDFGSVTVEANAFNLIELILKGNKAQANRLYHDIIEDGVNPVSLLAIISSQMRFFYQVKLLLEQHGQGDVARLLKANPYRVKMSLGTVRNCTLLNLSNKYLEIANLDYRVKSGNVNQDLIIEYLIN